MEMSPGEIFDRWTILRMKASVSEDMVGEMQRYEEAAHAAIWADEDDDDLEERECGHCGLPYSNDNSRIPKVLHQILVLMEANAKIWMLEASLRKEFKDDVAAQEDLDLAEVGRRAMMIRDINSKRVKAKTEIDIMYGVVPDEKVDHASQ
jgi:hypothetical protein